MKLVKSLMTMLMEMAANPVGFAMDETMSGTHRFVEAGRPAGDLPMSFTMNWGTQDLRTFLDPRSKETFCTADAKGHVTIAGLVEDADCAGTLELRYFPEARIRYKFSFKGKRGKKFHYIGEKINLRPWNLHRTHTTCYGTLYATTTGEEVSTSITYFRLSTLPAFLMSFRLIGPGPGRLKTAESEA